jgi:hypothetical protein
MDNDAQIEFIVETFTRVLSYEKQRLTIGKIIRNHLHEQLDQGVEIEHYRTEWLHSSIMRVLDTLEAIRKDFNREHTDDKCSTSDLLDIAASVTATLKNYTKGSDA